MGERLLQASVPLEWVVADCVYGSNLDLRTFLQARGLPYVLAVPTSEPVEFLAATGRRREEAALVETDLADPPTGASTLDEPGNQRSSSLRLDSHPHAPSVPR